MRFRDWVQDGFGIGRAARIAFGIFSLLIVLAASPAFASGDEGGPTLMDLIWQAANLALLLVVLVWVARKPVQNYFADRRDLIREDIETATELLQAAEARNAEWQRKLVDLESEFEQIRATSRHRAEEEREQIVAAAQDTAERIRNDASASVERELRRAQAVLREEAADLAMDLASKILSESVDDRDRERLVDEFITCVEPGNAPGGSES